MPKKILLADDSITIQKVVELTFSEGDYQVFAVSNGSQALKKIHEILPDIALLDVIMPETNGYEVCEQVKHDPKTSRIPVLLLTGTFEPFDRKRADSVGADGHLTKPFESQVLISRVEELIAASSPMMSDTSSLLASGPESHASQDPGADSESASPRVPDAEDEEEILQRIVPDRYDELRSEERSPSSQEGDGIRTLRMDQIEVSQEIINPAPPGGQSFPRDPVADTWDELASGLSATPTTAPSDGRTMAITPDRPEEGGRDSFSAPLRSAQDGAFPVSSSALTAEQVNQVTSQVLERLSDRVVREIAWEVIPEIAETLIRQRIRELEEKIAREG